MQMSAGWRERGQSRPSTALEAELTAADKCGLKHDACSRAYFFFFRVGQKIAAADEPTSLFITESFSVTTSSSEAVNAVISVLSVLCTGAYRAALAKGSTGC